MQHISCCTVHIACIRMQVREHSMHKSENDWMLVYITFALHHIEGEYFKNSVIGEGSGNRHIRWWVRNRKPYTHQNIQSNERSKKRSKIFFCIPENYLPQVSIHQVYTIVESYTQSILALYKHLQSFNGFRYIRILYLYIHTEEWCVISTSEPQCSKGIYTEQTKWPSHYSCILIYEEAYYYTQEYNVDSPHLERTQSLLHWSLKYSVLLRLQLSRQTDHTQSLLAERKDWLANGGTLLHQAGKRRTCAANHTERGMPYITNMQPSYRTCTVYKITST